MDQRECACPDCGTVVPENTGFTSWCECGWNLQPHRPDIFQSFTDRISIRYGDGIARSLFESMQGSVPHPRMTFSKVTAFVLAGLVHLSSLLLVALGIWLLASSWPNLFAIMGGLVLFAIAWIVRPRIRKQPERVVSRAEYPELYRLVDEVADALEHRPIKGIALLPEFNAFYITAGLRGDAYIGLGLPLWRILSAQERVGLLGHEIGHGVNGDVQRGVFVGSAVGALATWYSLLRPDSIFDNELGGPGLLMIPFNLVMAGLAQIPYGAAWLLIMLMQRDSQRAEYLADHLESTIGGTEAALSGLEKLHYGSTVRLATQHAALRNDSPFFSTLDSLMSRVPQREIERIRRVTLMEDSRIDASHPPTALRYRFIQARPAASPRILLDRERCDRIDRELASAYARCEKDVVEGYRAQLYV